MLNKPGVKSLSEILFAGMAAGSLLLYGFALTGWFFSPASGWIFAFLSPAFIWLWLWLLLLWAGWVRHRAYLRWLFPVALAAGWQPLAASFSVGRQVPLAAAKKQSALRVMEWNCMQLPGSDTSLPRYWDDRKAAVNFLQQYRPDVICLPDFSDIRHPRMRSNIRLLRDTLGYAYHQLSPHAVWLEHYGFITNSTAIFSRLPPLQQGEVRFTDAPFPEAIVWMDVAHEGRPVRIVAAHFASMHIFSKWLIRGKHIRYFQQADSAVIWSSNVAAKLRSFQQRHWQQAQVLRAFLDTCSVPVILGADLNTVPAAYIYAYVKGSLTDGFLGSKTGMGNTYNYLLPNLRIDYLLHHSALHAVRFQHFTRGFFDHDHLLADYEWLQND